MAPLYNPEIEKIISQCETHEHFLKELVRGNYAFLRNYLLGGLRFGVARRWNSWYPSYFDVEGGCYVLIPGDLDPTNEDNQRDERIGVIVIDPGFKFIDILRANYQIEPRDISTVIVTHFHPDHMAGLLEYATIMNTSKQQCNIFLNETTFATFKSLQNAFITVNELHDGQIQEVMRYKTRDKKIARVTIKAIGVHHNELGNQHRSIGLILETTLATDLVSERDHISKYQIGILGDTDGSEEYISTYVDRFREVDILILHLGTFSNKKLGRGGKHLYIEGVKHVLERMEQELQEDKHNGGKKIVVLSEFGLELTDKDSLYRKLRPFIESHSWRLPLIFAGLYLQEQSTASDIVDSSDKKCSCFFARATLEVIGRVCASSKNPAGMTEQILNRKDNDELLIALAFQMLAFDSKPLRAAIKEIHEKLSSSIVKEREDRLLDGLTLERYLHFFTREIKGNKDFNSLRVFFRDLVQQASFSQAPLPIEHLAKCCKSLMGKASYNLENPTSLILYADKLSYVSEYAEARGLLSSGRERGKKKYSWAYTEDDDTLTGIGLLWTACLAGIFLLHEALTLPLPKGRPPEVSSLIRIGDFFKKDIETWANLIVGDIGCTFGIDPFTIPDNNKRLQGITIKSVDGSWISPYEAECFYDDDNEQISYRIPTKRLPY